MQASKKRGPQGENTGRWTAEEHSIFVKGLEQYGKEWKEIANMVSEGHFAATFSFLTINSLRPTTDPDPHCRADSHACPEVFSETSEGKSLLPAG